VSESMYANDKLNGKFTHWYTNGNKESEGFYLEDKLDGTITYYNIDGTLKEIKKISQGGELK